MPDYAGADYSEDTYRVVGGKHHHRTETGERVLLKKGDEFHPTLKQEKGGDLKGKAEKVAEGSGRTSVTVGADIGVRALPMTEGALKLALEEGLTESDFDGVEPLGASGDYLKSQVERIAQAKE